MGANDSRFVKDKSLIPVKDQQPTFDPTYGFPDGRPRKVMKVTEAEMYSAKVPLEYRDYCAHHYIIYNTCRRDYMPMLYKCGAQKHAYSTCLNEEEVDRYREYERERRLLERAKRKARKALRAEQEELAA